MYGMLSVLKNQFRDASLMRKFANGHWVAACTARNSTPSAAACSQAPRSRRRGMSRSIAIAGNSNSSGKSSETMCVTAVRIGPSLGDPSNSGSTQVWMPNTSVYTSAVAVAPYRSRVLRAAATSANGKTSDDTT